MSTDKNILELISQFDPITLDQMDKVKLMRRTDTKFVFNIDKLPLLLEKALDNYFMVEIENEREQKYETTYFDTDDYMMYRLHHNGKLNRFKIRIRKYVYSKQQFLEVKRKNNRGETIKNRIKHGDKVTKIEEEKSHDFLDNFTPYNSNGLVPKLGNKFIRLTLVNKDFSERITLDYQLNFYDLKYNLEAESGNVCIAEIKKGRDNKNSPFIKYLNELHIYSMGFSKYCMGIALLNPEVKSNLFKPRMRKIENI